MTFTTARAKPSTGDIVDDELRELACSFVAPRRAVMLAAFRALEAMDVERAASLIEKAVEDMQ